MSTVRRTALDAPAVALALDERGDVPGHLGDEQTHRNVGEGQPESECNSQSKSKHSERRERCHLQV